MGALLCCCRGGNDAMQAAMALKEAAQDAANAGLDAEGMLGAMGLEGDKKAKETLDPEQARSAHIQSISQHVSNVPRCKENMQTVLDHSMATASRIKTARKLVASRKATAPAIVDLAISDMMFLERAVRGFQERLLYSLRALVESEAEVLRELQYAAHLRGKRDMGLEDLAHTLHVLRDYPAIAPPYSAAAEAAAAAKTAAAGQES